MATRSDHNQSALMLLVLSSSIVLEYCGMSGGLGGVLCVTRLRDQKSLLVTRDVSSPRSEGEGRREQPSFRIGGGRVWCPVDRVQRVMDPRRQDTNCGPVISQGPFKLARLQMWRPRPPQQAA